MLIPDFFIHGAGAIAPAPAPGVALTRLSALEPDYTGYIPPMQLRRMSKAVRMGVGASRRCLESAGMQQPDAIAIGTAMGCLQDTEQFLSRMVRQEERMLTPTAFIQSTHNTVGGQIALLLGCLGSNMTFVHRGHSFEHALVHAGLYLAGHPGATLLAGGIDELTDTSLLLMQRAGVYTREPVVPANGNSLPGGSLAGEGAAFFAVSQQAAGAVLAIRNLHLFVSRDCLQAAEIVQQWAGGLEERAGLVLLGRNGEIKSEPFYQALSQGVFAGIPMAGFKQLCGEYATASAFALSLIVLGLQETRLQEMLGLGQGFVKPQRMLLVNHFLDHYSCWELEVRSGEAASS